MEVEGAGVLTCRDLVMITAFLTDSTLCIGCKACEVACKEWNDVPADGYHVHRRVL